MLTRRTLLKSSVAAAVAGVLPNTSFAQTPGDKSGAIDRQAVVTRHRILRRELDRRAPLQVGNGRFAFGADVTGLQTFVPFNTMAEWAWHKMPLPEGLTEADRSYELWDIAGRKVPFESSDPAHPELGRWTFNNPSRVNLARVGLRLLRPDGRPASSDDLTEVEQILDLWLGTLTSRFTFAGKPVTVTTACHPDRDALAVRIDAAGLASGSVGVFVDLPWPDGRKFAAAVGSTVGDGGCSYNITAQTPDRLALHCDLKQSAYHLGLRWSSGTLRLPDATQPALVVHSARYGADGAWQDVKAKTRPGIVANNAAFGDPAFRRVKRLEITYTYGGGAPISEVVAENEAWQPAAVADSQRFRLSSEEPSLSFTLSVSPDALDADGLPEAAAVFRSAEAHWPAYWKRGGVIDLSASADPRWRELERRVVLSQYLMAVNEAGAVPPQESGLVNNGWFGKFHMEMYWWHAAHWALWNRWDVLDRSTGVYEQMLPTARARAERQGYRGARWTKMAGPDFTNAPNACNATLVWQQPHAMFFAELEYRARPTPETLAKWQTVLDEAADFMASLVVLNEKTNQYDLAPPLFVVSENTDPNKTRNPAFELGYWKFGLRVAQSWRERAGRPREPKWDEVLAKLAPPPVRDGVYVTHEDITDMWTKFNFEHPALIGVYGWLPGDGVHGSGADKETNGRTLDRVMQAWNLNDTWGWDFPMLAMAAARTGRRALAVDLLLNWNDAFAFDDAGLVGGGRAPYPYFPGNGGLLYVVAMMAAGWDGSTGAAPGFPDGWTVRHEGVSPAL